ncbi:PTS sugar transporter subunit IIA [Ignavigranum ruoffiae]|uniref:PTS sugar transporter subunit IIA n=1 Tax=Ignavigranum ruoffiae TaxID=89093 RepID=UPI0024AD863C|nr:PTS sugar transporter subunit IIA [Ignavigranum ruoffiae]
MISEWINEKFIQLDVEATDKYSAIKLAAAPLEKEKVITPKYVDAIIENLEKFGPYFVIMPGIALPHAESYKNVKKNSLGILSLKKSIEFGNISNDPVKYIFLLASNKGEDHLQALSIISSLLEDKEFFSLLTNNASKEAIINYIKKLEKE